ncbi:MAG TPA: hypothetical protein PKO45_03470 [Rubrivivax sp.]|nr:hypothetical protein [Burkholderiales bacterium]HNT38160.1 hypothetical protein [Rubrivivax sp.]
MNLRHGIRLLHLVAAVLMGTFVYSPWGRIPAFAFVIEFVALPALALSGLALWLLPRLRGSLRGQRRQ